MVIMISNKILVSIKYAVLISTALIMCSCASNPRTSIKEAQVPEKEWIESVVNYQQPAPSGINFDPDSAFELTPEIKFEVLSRFATTPIDLIGKRVSKWMLDENGLNMKYDMSANLTPVEAYRQRRGNCLSFTLLLAALANELGVEIKFNSVDTPQAWDLNESLGMIFLRHINGVQQIDYRKKSLIFDLAIEEYSPGYPQSIIQPREASALLQNNMALDLIAQKKLIEAEYFLKSAISTFPENADIWVNLGVLKKRQGQYQRAIYALKNAYRIDNRNITAVSNLERLYKQQGKHDLAANFAAAARSARKANPYLHYFSAIEAYKGRDYKTALKSTNKALGLHKNDPRFYELKNLIAQKQGNFNTARKALIKARRLASSQTQAKKFNNKLESIIQSKNLKSEKPESESQRHFHRLQVIRNILTL